MSKIPDMCPKCRQMHSIQAVGERKGGFSGGKAIAGAVLFGPVGLVGGALGKKKIIYQCSKCGYTIEK